LVSHGEDLASNNNRIEMFARFAVLAGEDLFLV
jgi:hypothetical protein